jgi:hypothetical protein
MRSLCRIALLLVAIACSGSLPARAIDTEPIDKHEKLLATLEVMGVTCSVDEQRQVTWVNFKRRPTPEAIALIKPLPALQGVGLTGSTATGADLAFLVELPHLTKLSLDGNQLSAEGIATIGRLDKIETLMLQGSGITDETMALLEKLPRVSTLNLSTTRVTSQGWSRLRNLKSLSSLSIINLDWERSHPDEPQFGDADLAHLQGIDTLKTLSLYFGTRISDEGLAQLAKLESLESLKLYGDRITDAGLEHLARLKNLKSLSLEAPLTRLRLPPAGGFPRPPRPLRPAASITDAGLAHLAPLIRLEVLEIRNGSFSDEGMVHLAKLTSLKQLQLMRVTVSDAGVKHLESLQNLERFTLFGMTLSDEGLKSVGKMKKLQMLMISRGSITDAGLAHLAGLGDWDISFSAAPNHRRRPGSSGSPEKTPLADHRRHKHRWQRPGPLEGTRRAQFAISGKDASHRRKPEARQGTVQAAHALAQRYCDFRRGTDVRCRAERSGNADSIANGSHRCGSVSPQAIVQPALPDAGGRRVDRRRLAAACGYEQVTVTAHPRGQDHQCRSGRPEQAVEPGKP